MVMKESDQLASGQDPLALLAGGGEMGECTRAFDWSKTPVGPVADWPQSLKIAVRIMLDSRYAMWLGWGPDFTYFYNDAYAQMTLGPKHPWALGRSAREVWSEIWDTIGPRAESVARTGQATWDEGLLLFLERQGFPEETYHTSSYSPIPSDQGGVGGMLCVVTEDTERTIGDRRLRTLRELAARTTEEAKAAEDACQAAARTLAENQHDLPFVLIYLLDEHAKAARLAGITGLDKSSPAAPGIVEMAGSSGREQIWPLAAVLESGHAEVVPDLDKRFGPLRCKPWPDGPGLGSEFVVRLPVVIEACQTDVSEPGADEVAKSSLRIRIVDDNRDSADSLCMMLRIMGSTTRTTYDGFEAVSATEDFRPDVILLDIGLPKLDGFEACRRIRQQPGGASMIIVAQTGWGHDEDRQRTHDAGFDYHMVKPVDPRALMKLLAGLSLAKEC
jgi:CheY-like chemotaxis protein